jgi:hypothetical protein
MSKQSMKDATIRLFVNKGLWAPLLSLGYITALYLLARSGVALPAVVGNALCAVAVLALAASTIYVSFYSRAAREVIDLAAKVHSGR